MNESLFSRYSAPIATLLAAASILFVMMFTILARPAHAEDTPPPPQTVDKVLSFIEQGATTFAGTVRNIVAEYGTQTHELAKATAKISAWSELVPGLIWAGLFVLFVGTFITGLYIHAANDKRAHADVWLPRETVIMLSNVRDVMGVHYRAYSSCFTKEQMDTMLKAIQPLAEQADKLRDELRDLSSWSKETAKGLAGGLLVVGAAGSALSLALAIGYLSNVWAWAGITDEGSSVYMVKMAIEFLK